jgi:tRNA U34 5-methylaminomethyl-2-thiouridine-forming methyltransferase MnmC
MDSSMDFKGSLGNYKIIETEDKTKTLWSEYFDEACHNLTGAYEETIYNYILGCKIPEQIASHQDLHILDVGFGVGVGLLAVIDEIRKFDGKIFEKKLTYSSIELDEELFLWSMNNTLPFVKLARKDIGNELFYTGEYLIKEGFSLGITVFIGDGRLTLPIARERLPAMSAVFQDAFSPKKNPMLWSVEWFSFLREISRKDVRLSTYSSSVSIRKSLLKAGWQIVNAKGFGQKRTMTKASLDGETSLELITELNKSPTLELRDK